MIQRSLVFKLIFFILLSTSFFYVNKCLAQEQVYSAMVMDVTGNASVQRGGKNEKSPLKIGDLLYPGDAVAVAKKSTLTINYLASSRQEKWPEGTKFSVGGLETKNAPSGVEKSIEEVLLPQGPSNEHMGGYVQYDLAPPTLPPAVESQEPIKGGGDSESQPSTGGVEQGS
ncbi:MAG: hypothetical protein NTZ92_00630, partial [Candidatus Omnitrophica bacterium]|nr:hypothetical protein [Candidatus Omnitrophota bacterium]